MEKIIKKEFERRGIKITDEEIQEMAWRNIPQIKAALNLVYGKDIDDPAMVVRHILWEWDFIQSLHAPLDCVGDYMPTKDGLPF